MVDEWKLYQQKTADFFSELGLSASLEHKLPGARTTHRIDVYVEGSYLGINFRWVVECKAWKSSVPKEKVMALSSIVADVGADKGILLSEMGFQSGALRAIQNSNIILTSLTDLAAVIGPHLRDAILGKLQLRWSKVKTRLFEIKHGRLHIPPSLDETLMDIVFLELPLQDAAAGASSYHVHMRNTLHILSSFEEFVRLAETLISEAETLAFS